MKIKVECYSGYRSEETPRRIIFGKRQVEVVQILDRWLAPDHRYFKLLGDDDAKYIIRHDNCRWEWELVFFKQGFWDGDADNEHFMKSHP